MSNAPGAVADGQDAVDWPMDSAPEIVLQLLDETYLTQRRSETILVVSACCSCYGSRRSATF